MSIRITLDCKISVGWTAFYISKVQFIFEKLVVYVQLKKKSVDQFVGSTRMAYVNGTNSYPPIDNSWEQTLTTLHTLLFNNFRILRF